MKVVSLDPKKFKFVYQTIRTNRYGFTGEEQQYTTTLRLRPVTFCGSLFNQAYLDTKSDKTGNLLARTEKTMVEWKTKWHVEMTPEKIDAFRGDKIMHITDFLKDVSVVELVEKITNKVSFADVYIKNKTTEDALSKPKWESQCPYSKGAGGKIGNY